MTRPQAQPFFDEQTATFSYVVHHPDDPACAIIDSVLDYDPKSGRVSTDSADAIIDFIERQKLKVAWLLETHAHADHFSAACYLRERLGGKIAIGEHIVQVQDVFTELFNLKDELQPYGKQFDRLFKDGDTFQIGSMQFSVMHVPGHTPADVAYHVRNLGVFIGDTLFMPDVGTARCDFPGGDAGGLYESIERLLSLDDDTTLFLCHDYPPEGRSRECRCTVGEQRAHNIHVHTGITKEAFIAMRTERDRTLAMPVLILPAIQINIRAGAYPAAEENGVRYLKIPLNQL